MSVLHVSPFQGFRFGGFGTQGDASSPWRLRSALGYYVSAPSGRRNSTL